jgi:hypothetical protein
MIEVEGVLVKLWDKQSTVLDISLRSLSLGS